MIVALEVILSIVFIVFRVLSRGRMLKRGPVWDGGLRHLWSGITYTATGFSNPVRVMFEAVLQPAAGEDSVEAVAQHFRTAIRRSPTDVHIVDRMLLDPSIFRAAAARQRRTQDAHRPRQCLCGLCSAGDAYCARLRRGHFLTLPRGCSVTRCTDELWIKFLSGIGADRARDSFSAVARCLLGRDPMDPEVV
jgi:hypothetical protein